MEPFGLDSIFGKKPAQQPGLFGQNVGIGGVRKEPGEHYDERRKGKFDWPWVGRKPVIDPIPNMMPPNAAESVMQRTSRYPHIRQDRARRTNHRAKWFQQFEAQKARRAAVQSPNATPQQINEYIEIPDEMMFPLLYDQDISPFGVPGSPPDPRWDA